MDKPEAIVLERIDDIGVCRIMVAIERGQLGESCLRLGARACDEGDLLISLGGGHEIAGSRSDNVRVTRFRSARLYDLDPVCRDEVVWRQVPILRCFWLKSARLGRIVAATVLLTVTELRSPAKEGE